jgi:hypothetical protein
MSCFTQSGEKRNESDNDHYENIDGITCYYAASKVVESPVFSTLDCKKIITSIPTDMFNIFSFTINVFTSEEKTLGTCEACYIKSNIILKPYFPLNTSIIFQGIVNGLSFKSSNQTIIPLNEDYLYIRIQNFNKNTQTIPVNMPLGRIVITAKQHHDL